MERRTLLGLLAALPFAGKAAANAHAPSAPARMHTAPGPSREHPWIVGEGPPDPDHVPEHFPEGGVYADAVNFQVYQRDDLGWVHRGRLK